jgi:hypothetical protein
MLQLADCKKASAGQTTALIDQENATEAAWADVAKLSENFASAQQELRSAHQTITELKAQLEVLPATPPPAQIEHPCTDSIIAAGEGACDSELLEFTDIKTELNRIDDQLSTLGNENEVLRTARCFNCDLHSCMILVS